VEAFVFLPVLCVIFTFGTQMTLMPFEVENIAKCVCYQLPLLVMDGSIRSTNPIEPFPDD
jgi:hypothetical protein